MNIIELISFLEKSIYQDGENAVTVFVFGERTTSPSCQDRLLGLLHFDYRHDDAGKPFFKAKAEFITPQRASENLQAPTFGDILQLYSGVCALHKVAAYEFRPPQKPVLEKNWFAETQSPAYSRRSTRVVEEFFSECPHQMQHNVQYSLCHQCRVGQPSDIYILTLAYARTLTGASLSVCLTKNTVLLGSQTFNGHLDELKMAFNSFMEEYLPWHIDISESLKRVND